MVPLVQVLTVLTLIIERNLEWHEVQVTVGIVFLHFPAERSVL